MARHSASGSGVEEARAGTAATAEAARAALKTARLVVGRWSVMGSSPWLRRGGRELSRRRPPRFITGRWRR